MDAPGQRRARVLPEKRRSDALREPAQPPEQPQATVVVAGGRHGQRAAGLKRPQGQLHKGEKYAPVSPAASVPRRASSSESAPSSRRLALALLFSNVGIKARRALQRRSSAGMDDVDTPC